MIYLSNEPCIIKESELCYDLLIQKFLSDSRRVVYVYKNGKTEGIITLGNFRRYYLQKKTLIQKQFTFVRIDDEDHALKIMDENPNIYALPVLDEKMHIIKEYRKPFHEDETELISCEVLLRLYKEFIPSENNAKALVITRFSDEAQRNAAEKIQLDAAGKLVIKDELDMRELAAFADFSDVNVVYDCIPESFRIREIIYKKLEMPYSLVCRVAQKDIRHTYEDYLLHYESVGVLACEKDYFTPPLAFHPSISVSILQEKQLVWRSDKECYEYAGELQKIPEALCVSCCILKNPCIMCGSKKIPIISKEWPIFEQYTSSERHSSRIEARSSDYDIVYNILPRLQKNNIHTLIISNIDMEWQKISQFDKRNWLNLEYQKTRGNDLEVIRHFLSISLEDEQAFLAELQTRRATMVNGYLQIADMAGKYINVFQGERLTIGNPVNYEHTLWLFGPCLLFGTYVKDSDTIGSLLRKKISNHYYIKNMGFWFESRHLLIRDSKLKSGDIVILYSFDPSIYREAGYEVVSLLDIYQHCSDLMDHILDACTHADSFLMKKIANKLLEVLNENYAFAMSGPVRDDPAGANTNSTESDSNEASENEYVTFGVQNRNTNIPEHLKQWLRSVKQYQGSATERVGAIVMNCNPFTLGHRYLIETASAQVDRLLIFVVEEDKSFFKFEDRICMVKLGTEDLKNVTVVPSGKYIISAQTLPGYFEKDDNPDVVFDASSDLQFFAKVIAKELNIRVRFAGEEPIDNYTRQYNVAMSITLPQHGIEFIEIPRKECGGMVISASRVRKLMQENRHNEIRDLVLPQVYAYLECRYFCIS